MEIWYNGDIEKGFNGPGIEWWGWTLRINGNHQKRRFSPDKQLDLTNTHDGLNNNCVVENHNAQTFWERFHVGYDQQESAAILQESAASSLSIQKEWQSKWNQVQFQWFIILIDQHCSRSKKGAELQKTPLKLDQPLDTGGCRWRFGCPVVYHCHLQRSRGVSTRDRQWHARRGRSFFERTNMLGIWFQTIMLTHFILKIYRLVFWHCYNHHF